jgi:AbrB family looped-hinge helix DNA binding protein
MRTIEATVTSQGPVTIPAEIRRALGLGKPGKVNFVIDTDSIRLEAPRFTLESVFGSVEPVPGTSEDFDDEIEAAMAEEVDRLRIGGERR